MSNAESTVPATTESPEADESHVRSRTGLPRVTLGLFFAQPAWLLPNIAITAVLLPAKVALIDPEHKIPLLAAISVVGAIFALIGNFLFGALSDRTRSRFGARSPWILAGGVAVPIAAFLLSRADSFLALLAAWCLFQLVGQMIFAAAGAILPDRVKRQRRGTIASLVSLGLLISASVAQVIGAQFLANPDLGMIVVGVAGFVFAVLVVIIAPDFDNRKQERDPFEWKSVRHSFALPNPRLAPDFYWAFGGRLLIILGSSMLTQFQLYILTDYVKLDQAAAAGVISGAALLGLVGALIGGLASGPISDRIGRRKLPVIVASLLFAVAIVVLLVSPSVPAFLVFATLSGLGNGAYFAVDTALLSDVLPSTSSHGKDLGILGVANGLGQVLGPAASSGIVAIGFGFPPVFAAAVVACIVGAVVIMPIKSVR